MPYLREIWKAVGRKLVFFPAALSALLGLFGLPMTWQPGNALFWYIVATPLVVWLIGGLLHRAVKLQGKIGQNPKADTPICEAFRYLMLDSKWALGKEPTQEFLVDVEAALRDAARNEQIRVWGRKQPKVRGVGYKETLGPIPIADWESYRFYEPMCLDMKRRNGWLINYSDCAKGINSQYEDVQINQRQLVSNWEKANWFEKQRDKTRKSREDFFDEHQKDFARARTLGGG